jgi:outer membrane lipoprotein SlyB
MTSTRLVDLGLVAALAQGCATSHTYSRTEDESQEPAAQTRYGRVQTVREEVRRVDSEPAEDALSGAFIGASIGAYRPAMLFGSAGGNTLGAFATDDRTEARRFDVTVRFDDGSFQTFSYNGYSPFRPGEPVVLTPRGLLHG